MSQKYTGENAIVKVLRDSKIHEFNIKLTTRNSLVPAHINGCLPSYYIVAGLVFTVVTIPYLRSEVNYFDFCTLKHKLFVLNRTT